MAFDFSQLVRDLQKIQVKLDEGFVEEAQEQLEFVIGEINIESVRGELVGSALDNLSKRIKKTVSKIEARSVRRHR